VSPDNPKPAGSTPAKAAFWIILGAQWMCVPFLALMLFFGLLGWPHYSPEDKRALLLAVAYIPALVAAGFVGVRLLRRRQHAAAMALALAPPLLWLPTVAPIVTGIRLGG
jgi:hypothetical protein